MQAVSKTLWSGGMASRTTARLRPILSSVGPAGASFLSAPLKRTYVDPTTFVNQQQTHLRSSSETSAASNGDFASATTSTVFGGLDGSAAPLLREETPPPPPFLTPYQLQPRMVPGKDSKEDMFRRFTDRATYWETTLPVERSKSLLSDAYTVPEYFELEKERIFKRTWMCVGYTSALQNVGDTITVEVADQPIIITKNKEGELKGYFNACRHRGSKVVTKDGNYRMFACPYHCWTYNLNGKLIGTSLFNQKRKHKLDQEAYGLFPVDVDHWGPFVFVNLDPLNKMSLHEYLGDLPTRYKQFFEKKDGKEHNWKLVRHKNYDVNANWKNTVENFNDYYHLNWIHPRLATTSTIAAHIPLQGPGMYAGFGTVPLSNGNTPADYDFLPAVDTLSSYDAKNAYFVHIFPNISLFLLPHHIFSLVHFPKAVNKTLESADLLMTDETLSPLPGKENNSKVDEIFQFWDTVNVEDVLAVEDVQKGQQSTAYVAGPFSHFEALIHRLQNMVIDSVTTAQPLSQQTAFAKYFDKKQCDILNAEMDATD